MQSASSYFRKFAQDNVGSNFRRPEIKDEEQKRANDIFKKYAKSSSSKEYTPNKYSKAKPILSKENTSEEEEGKSLKI